MKMGTIVRVNFLVLALFLVIMAMSAAKKGGFIAGINKIFGVSQHAPASR